MNRSIRRKVTLLFCGLFLSLPLWAITTSADCNGWRAGFDPMPKNNYVITATLWLLVDGVFEPVAEDSQSQTLLEDGPLSVGAEWAGPPATGSYQVTFRVDVTPLTDPYGYSSDLETRFFECIGPDPEPEPWVAPRSPGYWKNHGSAWPVQSLTVGDQTLSKSCLIAIMQMPTRGDARISLLFQLIGAKLNILNGSNPALIEDVIAAADQYLALTGSLHTSGCPSSGLSGAKPKGSEKNDVNAMKDALDAFNHSSP